MDELEMLFAQDKEPLTISLDEEGREIWVDGQIGEYSTQLMVRAINKLTRPTKSPITIVVNSVGGMLTETLAITDYMQWIISQGITITTIVMGVAYSGGALIATAGSKGSRVILPSSRMLIHQLSSETGGKMEDIHTEAAHLRSMNNLMIDLLVGTTGQKRGKIQADLSKEYYLSAAEAVSYGLVDKILGSANPKVKKK